MKQLIVYYSYSGATRRLAQYLAAALEADIQELLPVKPYSFNYNTAVKEARGEIERGYCPPLSCGIIDVSQYDCVWVGSPNWLKTFAPPVRSFLQNANWQGKTLVPFCTHGGGGFGNMEQEMAALAKGVKALPGLAAPTAFGEGEIDAFLKQNKFL